MEQCGSAYFNTAVAVRHGVLEGFYRKTHLVSGERVFHAGNAYPTFNLNGVVCGFGTRITEMIGVSSEREGPGSWNPTLTSLARSS